MDPVAFTLIALAGLAIAPKVVPLIGYGSLALIKKVQKKIKKEKRKMRRRNKELQKKASTTKSMVAALEHSGVLEFVNTENNTRKSVSIKEATRFDIDQDVLLKGTVRVRLKDGRIAEDEIYLFEPRVYGANNVPIGPKLSKDGKLLDKLGYLLKVPGDSAIYRGHAPLREVFSGERFDYVRDSFYASESDPLKEFIDIEIPKDKNGNYIPVDKSDVQAMEAFKKYAREREEYHIDQHQYLDDLLEAAKDAKEMYDYINRPIYASAVDIPDRADIQRVQRARASRAKREAQARAYYGTINRMNVLDTIMHEYNLDDHAGHLPGMGMMPLGPGMMPLSSMHGGGPAPGGRHL